eukprot:916132-Heterocapsa_arctica.AAC.1
MERGKPWRVDTTKLLHADDTLTISSTADAAELMLHNIQSESAKYNLNLNQHKCMLIIMNAIQTVRYADGQHVQVQDSAVYLGCNITSNGNQHAEIQA